MTGHKLVRLDAPAYWTRWAVEVDGTTIGYVERRGGFAPWTVKGPDREYLGSRPKRADAIDFLITTTQEGTTMHNLTDEQVDAAIYAWGDTDDGRVVADIITKTNLRDHVVPRYLDWLDTTMARPNLRQLLKDHEAGRAYLSSSAYLLATIAASVRHGEQTIDLSRLWSLGANNREALVLALASGLHVRL